MSAKTKGNNKVGRRSKYETHVKPRLKEIEQWIKEDCIEEQIAKNLGIAHSSLSLYKVQYSELMELFLKRRIDKVAIAKDKLFERVCGMTYEERTVYETIDEDGGKKTHSEIKQKYIPPDVAAINLFLKNNDKDWSNDPALTKLKQQSFELEKIIASEKHWMDLKELNEKIDERVEGVDERNTR